MHIHSHKVNLTPDEVEIIGDSISAELSNLAKQYQEKGIDMKEFDGLYEPEINLLRGLTELGYSLWIPGKDVFDGRFTTSLTDWIESLKVV